MVIWQMPVSPGRHVLSLSVVDEVNATVPGDARALVLGVKHLRLTMRPQ
jgi:hypothetical protein